MMFPFARTALVAVIGAFASAPMLAQDLPSGDRCAAPDTLLVRGAVRTAAASVLTLAGLTAGTRLTAGTEVQRAIQAIFASGDYDDVRASCDLLDNGKAALVFDGARAPVASRHQRGRRQGPDAAGRRGSRRVAHRQARWIPRSSRAASRASIRCTSRRATILARIYRRYDGRRFDAHHAQASHRRRAHGWPSPDSSSTGTSACPRRRSRRR